MLIHFEPKRRLRITISTRNHGLTEQAIGPSADSFASSLEYCQDNKPTCYRHRTWRFRRFVMTIQHMHPESHATVDHDGSIHPMYSESCRIADPNEPPPAYEPPCENLDSSQVHELPSDRPVAELPAGPLPVELESPMQPSANSSFVTSQTWLGYPVHEYDSAFEHAAPQTPDNLENSRLPWSLNTQQYFVPDPGMTSCQQSQNSSPISLDTPGTDVSYGMQFSSGIEVQRSMGLPHEIHSPSQSSWATPTMSPMSLNLVSQNHCALSSSVSLAEQPHYFAQGSGVERPAFHGGNHVGYSPSPYSSGSETCIASSNVSLATGSSIKAPFSQTWDQSSILPGIHEYQGHRAWQHQLEYDLQTSNTKIANHPTMRASPSRPPLHIGQSYNQRQSPQPYAAREEQQLTEVNSNPETREEADASIIHCSKCDKAFRGKYRKGNLKRHDLAFHNPLASAVGKACRVCKRAYNRADATKKHEWKKHRLPDARPKKRNAN